MKILLIRPPSELTMRWANIPLGIGYIASILEKSGLKVAIKDFLIERYSKERLVHYIRENNIDVVGLSVMTLDSHNAKAIIKDIKTSKDVVVVVGGPHATVEYTDLLRGGADFAVIGEGEDTVLDLMKYLNQKITINEVKGIAYQRNHRIFVTEKRPIRKDLDGIPFPAFHLLKMERYADSAKNTGGFNILSSRGCPADCHFCLKSVFGYRIRKRRPENVANEIKLLYEKYNMKSFCFVDDYFLSKNEWIEDLCDQFKSKKIKAKFWAQGRVDNNIKPSVFKKMVDVGFEGISFGIESGDQDILNSIGKRITLTQAEETVLEAKQAGFLMVEAGFILGFPNDTIETMERTAQYAGKINTTNVHATFFTPYPGTKIRAAIEKDANIKFEKDYRKLNLVQPTLTTERFEIEDLWKFYYRILYIKMKKRFLKESANLPAFILSVIKENRSLKQTAYMHFPAMFSYASSKLHRYNDRIHQLIRGQE